MITLYLHGRVATSRSELEAFLRDARSVYEEPGGITTRLQWHLSDPRSFVEIFEYADRMAFEKDQVRVATDPQMKGLLAQWHEHLEGPPTVSAYEEAALEPAFRHN